MLNISNKIFILIFVLLFSSHLYANEFCLKNSKLKYSYFRKVTTEETSFCTNKKGTIILSTGCFKRDKCQILRRSWNNDSDLWSEVGKPGFKLCRDLGGNPQIIEFEVNKIWYKLDRCLFEGDKSFVDTGTLLDHYLN